MAVAAPARRKNDEILVYIPSFAGGGVERVFVRIANEMARTGQKVRFVVNTADGPIRPILSANVDLVDLKASRTRNAIRPLARLLAATEPAALISALTYNNFSALVARRIAGVSMRIVISERAQVSGVLTDFSFARRHMTLHLLRKLYPLADAVTAVSSGTADDLERVARINRHAITVIPNAPPDPSEFEAARAAPCPHPWFAEEAGPIAIAIGRLEPQKNYPLMLKVLSRVRRRGVPLRLLILGEGKLRGELSALAGSLGLEDAVQFEGFVPNRLDYLTRADAFVMTSTWEGYPNALLEAVACGVPAVSTDCAGGGAREIMGASAVCPSDDAESLTETLLRRLGATHSSNVRMPQPITIGSIASSYVDLALGTRGE